MIKIYLLDFSGADADGVYRTALPSYIESYIDKTGNEALKRERIFSYFLLSYAYEKEFSCVLPSIERDENGRPYIPDLPVDFNISHDGEISAVVLSDDGRVGIDIQLCKADVSERLIRKTEKIYEEKVAAIKEKSEAINTRPKMLTYSNGALTYCDIDIFSQSAETEFFAKWSQLEAISKADGRGLALFSEIDFDKACFDLKTDIIRDKNGKSYALSVAIKKLQF